MDIFDKHVLTTRGSAGFARISFAGHLTEHIALRQILQAQALQHVKNLAAMQHIMSDYVRDGATI